MRIVYAVVWAAVTLVGMGFAPPNRPDLWAWLVRLMTGDWAGENPLVVAHFQLMGVWPLLMIALWRREWRRHGRLPAWPFLIGSFVLGCYAAMPYAFLRKEPALGDPGVPRLVWGVLGSAFLALAGWGLAAGDVAAWAAAVRTDGFMWPMMWDFLLFAGLFVAESRGRLWGRGAGS
jgi:hypothetical protein